MAVQTIKATIQMRCGMEADLQPDNLVTGEWAVAKDTRKVWMCFRPGLVLRMATYEAFEQDMVDIQTILATCRDIQAAVERFGQLAEQHASQAETWSITSKSWAIGGTGTREGEDADNSKYYSERSKSEADRAKNEADRAAAIAGIDIDSELSETSANPVQNKVIAKVLAKLKEVAFSGSYTDLSNKPTIPTNMTGATASAAGETGLVPAPGAGKQNAYLRGDGTWATPATTLAGTVEGIPLDQTMGKVLDDKISEINSNLSNATKTTVGTATKGEKFSHGAPYYVRNGICIVSLESTPSAAVSNGDVVLSGLPKPYGGGVIYLSLQTTNGNCYSAIIRTSGNLEIYFPAYTTASRIDTCFSYFTTV